MVVLASGPTKRVGRHTLRHSFAIHVLQAGADVRIVQELPWRADVPPPLIFTHDLQRGADGMVGPIDRL